MKHTEKYEELIPILGITEVHQIRLDAALRNISYFYEDLSRTIVWMAETVWPLISSDSSFNVRLACALMDIQPDAHYWDRVLVIQEEIKMNGYIIESESGGFLSKDYFWFPHDRPEDAWVHPWSILEYLRAHASTWESKPAKVYPAVRDEEHTIVLTEPFEFEFTYMRPKEKE